MRRISIFIADDHPVILRGLRELFDGYEDLEVIGEESDGWRVLEAATRLMPDVAVLDYQMPGLDASAVIHALTHNDPKTPVVVLSMHSNAAYVSEALRSGALCYVTKCVGSDTIVKAIRKAFMGQTFLSPPLKQSDIDGFEARVHSEGGLGNALTRRELDVFYLVIKGHTSGEVAECLNVGRRTVESHRASILAKLGLRNQAEMIRYAARKGILSDNRDG